MLFVLYMEFRNICGDCNDTGHRCFEFAVDENQSNRNKCCCGHQKNMHKTTATPPPAPGNVQILKRYISKCEFGSYFIYLTETLKTIFQAYT